MLSSVEGVSHLVVLTYDNAPFFSEKAVTLLKDQVHPLLGLLFCYTADSADAPPTFDLDCFERSQESLALESQQAQV